MSSMINETRKRRNGRTADKVNIEGGGRINESKEKVIAVYGFVNERRRVNILFATHWSPLLLYPLLTACVVAINTKPLEVRFNATTFNYSLWKTVTLSDCFFFFFWNINWNTLQRDWIFRGNFRSPPILRKSRGKNYGYETMIWPQIFIPRIRAASSRLQSSLVVPKSILLLVAWWRWGHGGEKAGKNGRGEKRETFPVQSTTRTGSRLWNSDGS